ncbi:hypothetical protein DRQ25_16200 [Candidatus Fermentibacteria bacterium]|nr:MAG: hypothetical protein DRQ25_16200 [Candidatus Fermentibacteria bacterium]
MYIILECGSTMPDLSNIPTERVKRISELTSNAYSELNAMKDRRVLSVDIPSFGKDLLTDPRILDRLRMYWSAASLKMSDYSRMKTISDILMNYDSITIRSGQYNELDVRYDRNSYALNAGPFTKTIFTNIVYYIPSGEVSFLPMEKGINGNIYGEICCGISGRISGIRLRIENNIVVDAKADEGQEHLNSMLESHGIQGRTVSQISFGLNSEMKSAELLPEIASKLYGSINITFGNNIMLGGNITDPQAWSVISVSPDVFSGKELILSNNEYHCK